MSKSSGTYTIEVTIYHINGQTITTFRETGTLEELKEYFRYMLDCGAYCAEFYNRKDGGKKVNLDPKSIKSLVNSLNNAADNCCTNYKSHKYILVED